MASWRTQIDFGAFPGSGHATITVPAPGITAGSTITGQVLGKATTDHTADEHVVEKIKFVPGDITEGTSFVAHAVYTGDLGDPSPASRQPALYGLWFIGGEYTT